MRQNRHCLVKFWRCQIAMSILLYAAKALLQLFCLQPILFGWRQNSFSGAFASWGKIKIHYFTWTNQDSIGLMIFKKFADQDWIGFNFIGSGLDSDWKISQCAHLCNLVIRDEHWTWTGLDKDYSKFCWICFGPGVWITSKFRNQTGFRLSQLKKTAFLLWKGCTFQIF